MSDIAERLRADDWQRLYSLIANMASGNGEVERSTKLGDLDFDSLDCAELDIKVATEFGLEPWWADCDFYPEDTVGKVADRLASALNHEGKA